MDTEQPFVLDTTGISDIMSGLMMVFLLVSVAFMLQQQEITKDMVEIAKIVEKNRQQINIELNQIFGINFSHWGAELLPDNTVRFNAPEVLFQTGKADLTARYQKILQEFFPRYVEILYKHRDKLAAIRIEGHTSSEWQGIVDERERFLKGMGLSQNRALETLSYCFRLIEKPTQIAWLRKILMGNGRSFGDLIVDSNNKKEIPTKSRRVEFKIFTKTEDLLNQILARGTRTIKM